MSYDDVADSEEERKICKMCGYPFWPDLYQVNVYVCRQCQRQEAWEY